MGKYKLEWLSFQASQMLFSAIFSNVKTLMNTIQFLENVFSN
jgi:hypothetical protein